MLDQKTKQVLSGFPANVPVASDPSDPLNKLVSGAYSSGLRFLDFKLQQTMLGRFPVGAHLTEVREVCSTSLASKFINPIVRGVNVVGAPPVDVETAFTVAETEEDFLYGKPTAAHLLKTEVVAFPAGYEVDYDVSGLAYTRPDSTLPGQLHYLINTWADDVQYGGKILTQSVSTNFGSLTFSAASSTPTEYQSLTQSYDVAGYDAILTLEPTDPDAGTSLTKVPLTTYIAEVPHSWVGNVVVYDIVNLDANGEATVVDAAEYTLNAETGTITFNTFLSGAEYVARPSYLAGTQGDPGWNSTYMAEYTYSIYRNAFGLSPLNYLQDTGNRNDMLLAGMTPNNVVPVPIAFELSSYSFDDKAVCLRIGGYDLAGLATVTVSCVYTNVLSFQWNGSDIQLTDYIAKSDADLSTTAQQMLALYDAEVGCNLVKIEDGLEIAIESAGYSIVGQTWGSVIGSLHVEAGYADVGTQLKLYYKSIVLLSPSPVQAHLATPADYADFSLIQYKGIEYALVDKLLCITKGECTGGLASIIDTLNADAYKVARVRIINNTDVLYPYTTSTAYDPYRNVVWVVEDEFLVSYNSDRIELGRWPLIPYTEGMNSSYSYPFLYESTTRKLVTASVCFWRRWLLVAYRVWVSGVGTYDYVGILDPERPDLGVTGLGSFYTEVPISFRPLVIAPLPDDSVAVIRDTPSAGNITLYLVKLDFNYYWSLDNKLFLRKEIKGYDKLRVIDNGVTTNVLNASIATEPVATGLDNMLNILGMSRIEGYGNEEDAKRAGALLKYTANSTHQGLTNAVYNELIMTAPPKVRTTTVFTLSRAPLTIDSSGIFYPVTVTVNGVSYGTQGVNLLPGGNKPAAAVYTYDALGNVTTTWDWLVWMDQAMEYTRHFEFRAYPPMVLGVAQRFNVTYYIKNASGEIIPYTETFFPETERETDQPVWIGLDKMPYAMPLIGLWGLNDKEAMKRVGFLDRKSLPTSKLLALVRHQDSITKLRWENGEWNFTCWTDVAEQVRGLEYIPCRFDVPFTVARPIVNPDAQLADLL